MNSVIRALALVMIIAVSSAAVPVARPTTAEHQWTLGVIGAYDRVKIEGSRAREDGDLKSHLWIAEAAYGFNQDIEAVFKIGTSNDRYTNPGRPITFSSKFNWGLGLRGTMYESWRDWRINGDLQYFTRPGRTWRNADVDIREWQMAVSVEHALREFHPYYGINYNRLDVRSNNRSIVPEMVNQNHFGVHLGAGFSRSEDWSFLVEARFLNATAFAAGATFHF